MQMFNKADPEKTGFLNQQQLKEVIKDDITNGHEKYASQQNSNNVSPGQNRRNTYDRDYKTIESENFGTGQTPRRDDKRLDTETSSSALP